MESICTVPVLEAVESVRIIRKSVPLVVRVKDRVLVPDASRPLKTLLAEPSGELPELVVLLSTKTWKVPAVWSAAATTVIVQVLPDRSNMPSPLIEVEVVVEVDVSVAPTVKRLPEVPPRVRMPSLKFIPEPPPVAVYNARVVSVCVA